MNAILIPTVTNSFAKFSIHLFSPRKNKPENFAKETTIVDCHTGYLKRYWKKYTPNEIISHYHYYTDFCKEYSNDDSKILVFPDIGYILDLGAISKIRNYWENNIDTKTFNLLKTKTPINSSNYKFIDYASSNEDDDEFFEWKHGFSKYYVDMKCDFLTFDSQDFSEYDEQSNIAAAAFIQNLIRRQGYNNKNISV